MNTPGKNAYANFKRGYIVTGTYPERTIKFGLCHPDGGLFEDVAVIRWHYLIFPNIPDDLTPLFELPYYSWYLFGLFQDVFEKLVAVTDTLFSPESFQAILNECGFIRLEEEQSNEGMCL